MAQEYRKMHGFLHWFLVLWMEMIYLLQAISKCLRGTPRSTIFRWIAIYSASENFTWLTSPSHIWCRNIEWWLHAFLHWFLVLWMEMIYSLQAIPNCLRGTPRSTIFRWIAICSSSENFTWLTSPYLVSKYGMMHVFLHWLLVLWMEIITTPSAICKCLCGKLIDS